jgi:triosephosphate isomerase
MINGICQYVIIGHSERRQYFKETDCIVNKKIKAAISNGLIPIICVGENIDQKNSNQTNEVLTTQIQESLREISPRSDIIIAYEPLWAIGTGKAAYGEEANNTIAFIRNIIKEYWNHNVARDIRILYGGSVKSKNILDFTSKSDIDGVLVGGASLNAEEFISIVRQSASQ